MDYRALNSLIPPVTKAHSKAKGVLTLVPLPKIDEIYARLRGSTIYSALDMTSGYHHMELSEEAKPKSAFLQLLISMSSIDVPSGWHKLQPIFKDW